MATTSPERCAHDRKDRAGDVHRAEHGGLDLRPEVIWGDFLKESGVKVARVIDEDVDPAEPLNSGAQRSWRRPS
jgi:hypothetical protein